MNYKNETMKTKLTLLLALFASLLAVSQNQPKSNLNTVLIQLEDKLEEVKNTKSEAVNALNENTIQKIVSEYELESLKEGVVKEVWKRQVSLIKENIQQLKNSIRKLEKVEKELELRIIQLSNYKITSPSLG